MNALRQRIEQKLQQRTDQIMAEAGGKLPADMFEPLYRHLDEVIRVVSSTQDYSTEPFMRKVRQIVCTDCMADPEGGCLRRAASSCGLDSFFPQIVGVIERELNADPGIES